MEKEGYEVLTIYNGIKGVEAFKNLPIIVVLYSFLVLMVGRCREIRRSAIYL